jgi:hypothetical protein
LHRVLNRPSWSLSDEKTINQSMNLLKVDHGVLLGVCSFEGLQNGVDEGLVNLELVLQNHTH